MDESRTCRVVIHEPGETFVTITGPDGATTCDAIAGVAVVAWLKRMRARREELERRRAACGNPRRPWGHCQGWRAAQDVLSNVTATREQGVADHNHAWSCRVVTRAVSWRCGQITVEGLPEKAEIVEQPWKWKQFVDFLKYKAGERGIEVGIAD